MSRHPILWLQSCLLNSAKDIKEAREQFFSDGDDSVIGFARLYNQFYRGWLAYKNEVGGYLILATRTWSRATQVALHPFLAVQSCQFFERHFHILPQSVQLDSEDLNDVINRKCSLPVDLVKSFWSNIDPDMAATLEYTFEEIDFSRTTRSR